MTKPFAKDLRRAQGALLREVRAACLESIRTGGCCHECAKYCLGVIIRPRQYITMPGGKAKLPMPVCGGTERENLHPVPPNQLCTEDE